MAESSPSTSRGQRFDTFEPDIIYKGRQYTHHSGLVFEDTALRSVFPKQISIMVILAVAILAALFL
ncbi:MAG TPA: hypothetical protein VMB52_02355, partial [Verrucomicrobiae bacterium]|nr:hypothetical protein [Verrucomicrobiae bacterium]